MQCIPNLHPPCPFASPNHFYLLTSLYTPSSSNTRRRLDSLSYPLLILYIYTPYIRPLIWPIGFVVGSFSTILSRYTHCIIVSLVSVSYCNRHTSSPLLTLGGPSSSRQHCDIPVSEERFFIISDGLVFFMSLLTSSASKVATCPVFMSLLDKSA